jgi:hypothetical protein
LRREKVEITENKLLYQAYGYNPNDYRYLNVIDLGFSKRLSNRLLENKIFTVEDILMKNIAAYMEISGFGQSCFNELNCYLGSLKNVRNENNKNNYEIKFLKEYRENILDGDFSFVSNLQMNELIHNIIELFRDGHRLLDRYLIDACIYQTEYTVQLVDSIKKYVNGIDDRIKIEKYLQTIPKNRVENKIIIFINAYSDVKEVKDYLATYCDRDDMLLKEFILKNYCDNNSKNFILTDFFNWCSFSIEQDIESFFTQEIKDDRMRLIIHRRSAGKALESIGNEVGITRERVRQIEKKIFRNFSVWQNKNRILFKIITEQKDESAILASTLMKYTNKYKNEFLYLLRNNVPTDVTYDKQLDIFVIGEEDIVERVQIFVDELPDVFSEYKITGYLELAMTCGLSGELIIKAINESYRKTGDTYHRTRLTRTSMYADILKRYYPNGMWIYNTDELQQFKERLMHEYGNIEFTSNRAISARLGDVGVLCGRGRYCSKKQHYISDVLANKIYTYIVESDMPIFLTNTLFSVFENELRAENVSNKYYLQGILRALYGDEFIFRRDYISKDESVTSVYAEVVNYIKNTPYQVSKQDIFDAFPGITEIVVNISVGDSEIINLFGNYIHSSHLKLSKSEINYIKNVVNRYVMGGKMCHCRNIYEFIMHENPTLLINNNITIPFSLLSLLEYLFRDNYNFLRPFIADNEKVIDKPIDQLREMILNSDRFEIADVLEFSREWSFQINSILGFLNNCNETHLLINENEIASIEYIGIDKNYAEYLEALIINEINGTVKISELRCVNNLKEINVSWNEWLIYSMLFKWSTLLEVTTSSNQFRMAVPVVAPRGMLNQKIINSISKESSGSFMQADDLEKIDDLIADYILEELGDGVNGF